MNNVAVDTFTHRKLSFQGQYTVENFFNQFNTYALGKRLSKLIRVSNSRNILLV